LVLVLLLVIVACIAISKAPNLFLNGHPDGGTTPEEVILLFDEQEEMDASAIIAAIVILAEGACGLPEGYTVID
jgi:hypothetical protein